MTQRFAFILLEDFSHLAFANAVEPLRLANLVTNQAHYSWTLLSADGRVAKASNGSLTQVHGGLDEPPKFDRLFVISGNNVQAHVTPALLALLRRVRRHGISVGAICSGAYVLARAGLLDGQRTAVHWSMHDCFREEFPEVELVESVFVSDAPIVTAAGGSAAADMMLDLIARSHGDDTSTLVADQMVYNAVRDSSAQQKVSLQSTFASRNTKVAEAIRIMNSSFDTQMQTHEIAERVGLSIRQLERLFAKRLGTTPQSYFRKIRMERAQRLLLQTEMSVMEVALACGYCGTGNFSKHYRRAFGVGPSMQKARASGVNETVGLAS